MSTLRIKKSQGFSMIELLVAIVISAIGLLGLAAMQMISIKNVNNSQFRTLATMYTYDMAERMRSNQAGVSQYVGTDTSSGTPCGGCSGIATTDVTAWKAALTQQADSGGLPSAVGTISLNGDVYSVTVAWNEQVRGVDGGQQESFTLSFRM